MAPPTINAYLTVAYPHIVQRGHGETKLDVTESRPGGIPERQQVFRGVPDSTQDTPNGVPQTFCSIGKQTVRGKW